MALDVAFLWHFHQPLYRDPEGGGFLLPWVRLHAVKDYWGMGKIVERSGAKVSFNWVPCLLEQIGRYLEGERDVLFRICSGPAGSLSAEEAEKLLDAAFSCNLSTMVYPYPRFRELHGMRRADRVPASEALGNFSERDLRDLQVWANLCWIHPLARQEGTEAGELVRKGRDFSEEEKSRLLEMHIRMMGEIVPLYRRLAGEGMVEITVSPYYHPILPLLCDMESAREALPKVGLPRVWEKVPEDARRQVEKGAELAEREFGTSPAGLWPSEGAVSGDVLDLAAEAGFRFTAADEGVLAATLGRDVRGADGKAVPEVLYRPYRFERDGRDVSIFFRDRELSDLIGFRYQFMPERTAADDLLGRLREIAGRSPEGAVVSIILDGENAWEHYPEQGVQFLSDVYGGLAADGCLRACTFSEHLERGGDRPGLERIFAGSWIDRNFSVWIGAPEDRAAWEEVFKARAVAVSSGRPEAMEHVYAAEGSDWFWWFGPDRSSLDDPVFDLLFRKHLRAAYRAAGAPMPPGLEYPIISGGPPEDHPPRGLVQPVLDGEVTDYFEWVSAGRVSAAGGAVLAASGGGGVGPMYYGFDREGLYIRLDARDGVRLERVVVEFSEPVRKELRAEPGTKAGPWGAPRDFPAVGPDGTVCGSGAAGRIVEIGVPFRSLEAEAGREVAFACRVETAGGEEVRLPAGGFVRFVVPEPPRKPRAGV